MFCKILASALPSHLLQSHPGGSVFPQLVQSLLSSKSKSAHLSQEYRKKFEIKMFKCSWIILSNHRRRHLLILKFSSPIPVYFRLTLPWKSISFLDRHLEKVSSAPVLSTTKRGGKWVPLWFQAPPLSICVNLIQRGRTLNCGLCPPLALPIALLPVVVKSDINARHTNPSCFWQTTNS